MTAIYLIRHGQASFGKTEYDCLSELGDCKRVAVFSSGGPIALLSQAFLGVPAENLMRLNWT